MKNNTCAAAVQIFLVAFIAAAAASCSVQDRARRVAYVYGVSLYDRSVAEGMSHNLRFCDDDANSMAALLESSGYTVHRRLSGTTYDTPSSLPTRAQIQADIASVGSDTDRAVFYYSGHGDRNDDSGTVSDYIVPYNVSNSIVTSDFISSTELHSWLAPCPAAQKILILDSCYSGGFVNTQGDLDLAAPVFGPNDEYGDTPPLSVLDPSLISPLLYRFMAGGSASSDTLVLSAAGSMEYSFEASGHGIFTGALLDSTKPYSGSTGAARADSDGDGVVSVIEAFSYAAMVIDVTWNAYYSANLSDGLYADYFPHVSSGSRDSILFSY